MRLVGKRLGDSSCFLSDETIAAVAWVAAEGVSPASIFLA